MEDQQQKKYQLMTETPVSRLIPRMALPCVVSMLVTAFYNMADTFFVGMLKSNAATGAVGQIKILTSENYKGGVRLSIVCGARALEAAQAMRARQADIGALLSAKANQTAVAVHRVYDEYTALKFNHFGLCSQLFDVLAAAVEPGQNAIRIVPGLDPDGLHRLAVRLSEATTGLCAALTPNDKGTGYCLAQAGGDVRALTKALNTALNGRGGGKPGICQGSCAATPEQVEDFLKENIDHENAL